MFYNMKKYSLYLIIVVLITAIAFFIDIYSSTISVELASKKVIDKNGLPISTLEMNYPLWYQICNLIKNFLYGLASAIFITIFVANRLELAQKDEKEAELTKLNEAINVNVFDSLFKTIIPEEIFKIIKQDIIENKVIRKDAKWVYDFKEIEGKVLCTQTTRYELHNLSQASVQNPIKLELDPLGGENYEIVLAECLDNVANKLVSYNPNKPDDNRNVTLEEDGRKISVAYTVNIPPNNYVEYKTVFRRFYLNDITDAQSTKVPVIGADIIVNYPEGYDFDISPMMSSKPRLISNSSTQKIYKIEGGILPWQGFVFYLKKVN